MAVPAQRDLGSHRWHMHTRFLIDAEEGGTRTLKEAQKSAKDKLLIFKDLALGQSRVQTALGQASWCDHSTTSSTLFPPASQGAQFPTEAAERTKCFGETLVSTPSNASTQSQHKTENVCQTQGSPNLSKWFCFPPSVPPFFTANCFPGYLFHPHQRKACPLTALTWIWLCLKVASPVIFVTLDKSWNLSKAWTSHL